MGDVGGLEGWPGDDGGLGGRRGGVISSQVTAGDVGQARAGEADRGAAPNGPRFPRAPFDPIDRDGPVLAMFSRRPGAAAGSDGSGDSRLVHHQPLKSS